VNLTSFWCFESRGWQTAAEKTFSSSAVSSSADAMPLNGSTQIAIQMNRGKCSMMNPSRNELNGPE
jgi:hypothetical protein